MFRDRVRFLFCKELQRVRHYSRYILIFAICQFAFFAAAKAQAVPDQDDHDLQLWNDVQLTVKLAKKVDLYASGTLWLGKNDTRAQEERAAIGVTFKPFRNFTFTPYVAIAQIRNFFGVWKPEERICFRETYKLPFKKIGVTLKSNYEYRFRRTFNSWRLGTAVTVDKDIPLKHISGLKGFITEEFFYDSLPKRFTRNRLSAGFNKKFNKVLSLDLYYLRQDDNFGHPSIIHAIGAAWKISL